MLPAVLLDLLWEIGAVPNAVAAILNNIVVVSQPEVEIAILIREMRKVLLTRETTE